MTDTSQALDQTVDASDGQPAIPTTDVPFPYDVDSAHTLDALAKDVRVTKTSKSGYRIDMAGTEHVGPYSSDGNPIPKGDAVAHLPVGTQIVIGVDGDTKVGLALPATESRPQIGSFGKNIFTAVRGVWAYLVTEGFAVLPAAPAVEAVAESAEGAAEGAVE